MNPVRVVTDSAAGISTQEAQDFNISIVPLKIQLGTTDDERMRLDQTRLVLDLETGRILDWDHSKVVMRGARK